MAIKHGTAGADTITGTTDADQLFGESGNDVLKGSAGPDTLDGGDGRDTADYGTSATGVAVRLDDGTSFGGDAGGDVYVSVENVKGSASGDDLRGDAASNRLEGGLGGDFLFGGDGFGNDTLLGGGGRDVIFGGAGAELLNGGGGRDTLSYTFSTLGVTVNLSNGQVSGGDAGGDTVTGFEDLAGSSGGDVLAGTLGANDIDGNEGADRLFGFAGDDSLSGDLGADTMTGGEGADLFVFTRSEESPTGLFVRDVVQDFRHDQGDRIHLANLDTGNPGVATFEFLGKDALTDAPGQISYGFVGTTTVVRIETAGAGLNTPEMEIQLQGNIDLVASDFVL